MAYIDDETINNIRSSANIVDIIKEYVPLTSKGKNFFGVCPFHQDHAPSMSVSSDKQIYRCFSCGAAGNVFTFVKDYENVSFLEAVSIVAKKVGISFNYSDKNTNTNNPYQKEFNILKDSVKFYQNNLFTEEGRKAIEYLNSRNFSLDYIKEFEFGLSFKGNTLLSFLNSKGYENNVIEKTSLVSLENNPHDVFVNRIMIPIHDLEGNPIGFTSRIFDNSDGPKYLNSKESNLFKKGKILFNFHRAKNYIRNSKKIIIVEGNMDALKLYAHDVKNVVALMGTALTSDQINVIKKLRVDVLLMLDNDDAGKLAMNNNADLLLNAGINTDIVVLEGAKDPDEFINNYGIQKLNELIQNPSSVINYKLEYYKNGLNLSDISDISKYLKLVINDIKKNPDKILVEITLKKLCSEYNIEYASLLNNFNIEVNTKIDEEVKNEVTDQKEEIKIDEAVANIILGMISNGKYISYFVKELGFLSEKWQRSLVNEIRYYYKTNNNICLADFITYLGDKTELQNILYEIIAKYGDLNITDELFYEYVKAEKKSLLCSEIKRIKQSIKMEKNEEKKRALAEELTKLKKEVELNGKN